MESHQIFFNFIRQLVFLLFSLAGVYDAPRRFVVHRLIHENIISKMDIQARTIFGRRADKSKKFSVSEERNKKRKKLFQQVLIRDFKYRAEFYGHINIGFLSACFQLGNNVWPDPQLIGQGFLPQFGFGSQIADKGGGFRRLLAGGLSPLG